MNTDTFGQLVGGVLDSRTGSRLALRVLLHAKGLLVSVAPSSILVDSKFQRQCRPELDRLTQTSIPGPEETLPQVREYLPAYAPSAFSLFVAGTLA